MRDATSPNTRTGLKRIADAIKAASLLILGPLAAYGQFWPNVTGGVLGCPYAVPFILCPACPTPCTFNVVRPWLFGGVMASSVLVGRVFCGLVCPLGVGCDLVSKLPMKKLRLGDSFGRIPHLKAVGVSLFLYLLAEAALIMVVGWSGGGLWAFMLQRNRWVIAVITAAVVIILLSSVFENRSWCRHLCPLGAVLSLFNRFSIVSVAKAQEHCEGCDSCRDACHLGDDVGWDSPDCLRCFSCYTSCSGGALRLKWRSPLQRKTFSSPPQ